MKPLTAVNVREISGAGPVMQDDNVKVSSIVVEHPPVKPALAYRFDFKDRSIGFSGDTAPLEAVAVMAKGADVLVHETMYVPAVEKYIKAVLVFLQIPFPKVRDIGELLRFVPGTFAVPLTVDEQEKLTFYATTGRYPGDYEPVSRSDAEEMIMAANKVRASIRGQLPPQLSAL